MDDLAEEVYKYLCEVSTKFKEERFVLIPITAVVKKFGKNHRTIQRRISALKEQGLLTPVIRRNTVTLYHIIELEY